MGRKDLLKLWKEEYEAIEKEISKVGETRETARRLLIFTQGFIHFIFYGCKRTLSREERKILEDMLDKIKNNQIKYKRIGDYIR